MNRHRGFARSLGYISFVLLTAAKPSTHPASQPTAAPTQSIAEDQIYFVPPPAPWKGYPAKALDVAYFQTADNKSALQAQWAPKDFQIASDTAGSFAVQIRKDLKKKHLDAKTEMVLGPKILKDSRFDIVIYERFKVGDFTQDQLHLYRSVGPRVMMVVVSCVSDDDATIKASHKAAEDLLVSCKFNRKAFKK